MSAADSISLDDLTLQDAPPAVPQRCPPAAVARARLRAKIMAARTLRRHPGIRPLGRLSGRLSEGLPPLPEAGLQSETPELALLLDAALANQVFDAAAAALLGHNIALAITPEALANLPIPDPARQFALRHRHLSLMPGEVDARRGYDVLRQGLVALWAQDLPRPLSVEFSNGAAPLALPLPEMDAPSPPKSPPTPPGLWARAQDLWDGVRDLIMPRKQVLLSLCAATIPQERARAALDAAMIAYLPAYFPHALTPEAAAS